VKRIAWLGVLVLVSVATVTVGIEIFISIRTSVRNFYDSTRADIKLTFRTYP